MVDPDWTPENLLRALEQGTAEDKRKAMAGIFDEQGNLTNRYRDWGDKVSRTPNAEPRRKSRARHT